MGPPPAVAETRRAVRGLLVTAMRARAKSRPARRAVAPIDDPPALARAVEDYPSGQLSVACSGGADSLALAAATAFVAPRLGVRAALVTVDHGLQPGSAAQAARVAALGEELGFDPVTIVRVTVGGEGGPEAAARDARYAALANAAGAAPVLLGHTLDDQAESVLLGLGRGSGSRSIAGMRAVDGRWLRPFLGLRRATTEAACAALGLQPWDDPHNADPSYRRVRVRREVLPLLEDVLAGGVVEALARTADLVRADADALDQWARDVLAAAQVVRPEPASAAGQGGQLVESREVVRPEPASTAGQGGQLVVGELQDLPKAVRTRVLRMWAAAHGAAPLTAERTAALDALVTDWRGQAEVQLPGGVRVIRRSDTLDACQNSTPTSRKS